MTTRYKTDEIISESGGPVEATGGMTFGGEQFHLSVADVTITEAELKALNATPKTLLGAPGAGKASILHSVELFLDYETTDYDGIAPGEDLSVLYETAGEIGRIEATGFLDASADARRFLKVHDSGAYAPSACPLGVNEAVQMQMLVDEIATGDSPLKVRVRYRTIDVLS